MLLIIPILHTGGILKKVILLLTVPHIMTGTTEVILSSVAAAPFYFLPVMVAFSVAKHFEADSLIAIVSVCTMLLPNFGVLYFLSVF